MSIIEKSIFNEVAQLTVNDILERTLEDICAFEIKFIKEEQEALERYWLSKRAYERAKLGTKWISGIKREKIKKEGDKNGK